MNAVVFDIETVGCDFARLDRISQEYFLRLNEAEEFEQVRDSLSFYPLTAQIVAIAMMDVKTKEGAVYFQDRDTGMGKFKEENFYFYPMDECGLLEHFWKQLRHYSAVVTFNGRVFDGPFIMIRSAVHHLRVERNLVPYRFSTTEHIDLADQLCFYGAMSRKFPLHLWCRALGIPSPKESGVKGLDVKDLFSQGEMLKIARYCRDDVEATRQLYERWRESFLS